MSCLFRVQFINLLKTYLARHGTITVEKLYEPPFDSVSQEGIDNVFSHDDVTTLVSVLEPFLAGEVKQ